MNGPNRKGRTTVPEETTRRTVYAATEGCYSDYSVIALFENREDAERFVAAGMAQNIEEMDLYSEIEREIRVARVHSTGLSGLWYARSSGDPSWFKRQYESAVERIEDHTDKADPHWYAPASEHDVTTSDGMINDPLGGHFEAGEIRLRAFELLVLADLAEVARGRP